MILMKQTKKQYQEYVNKLSPKSPLLKDILLAFLVGGAISMLGQFFMDFYANNLNMNKELSRTTASISLIFLSALSTGLGLYPKIAKFAGAGTLVPITGFANAVASAAIEFRREGYVLGLAAKMFTIAGPVLVYGISSSIALGLLYFLFNL
jgi:stage V sporulation protein AC